VAERERAVVRDDKGGEGVLLKGGGRGVLLWVVMGRKGGGVVVVWR